VRAALAQRYFFGVFRLPFLPKWHDSTEQRSKCGLMGQNLLYFHIVAPKNNAVDLFRQERTQPERGRRTCSAIGKGA